MKNIVILFVFLLFNVSLISQIKVKCDIETGYLNDRYSLNIVNSYPLDGFEVQYSSGNVFYCDISADFSFKNFHIKQQIFNMFSYSNKYFFSVMEIAYKTRIYYNFKSFSVGFEHMCLHPIIKQHNEIDVITRRGSYEKIFIKYTLKNY